MYCYTRRGLRVKAVFMLLLMAAADSAHPHRALVVVAPQGLTNTTRSTRQREVARAGTVGGGVGEVVGGGGAGGSGRSPGVRLAI
ncbi:hypothetical protein PR202_ga00099 [Eleusine coracana subsp. coracana]|uniref:Secreted protein n=1 Tax=Eleusine coracana subsp. coracana TaxID=191504 RepID=A0AAV5BE62_ELECO|nr:hypothetical protein PR202_ga00099 [Eleusine coracana subsp. coracana]